MAQDNIITFPITIVSGTTTDAIDLNKRIIVGVKIPAGISSTAMTISECEAKDGTYATIYDGLAQYGVAGDTTFAIEASKYIDIPPMLTAGCPFVKIVFGSSETAKTYVIHTREI